MVWKRNHFTVGAKALLDQEIKDLKLANKALEDKLKTSQALTVSSLKEKVELIKKNKIQCGQIKKESYEKAVEDENEKNQAVYAQMIEAMDKSKADYQELVLSGDNRDTFEDLKLKHQRLRV